MCLIKSIFREKNANSHRKLGATYIICLLNFPDTGTRDRIYVKWKFLFYNYYQFKWLFISYIVHDC